MDENVLVLKMLNKLYKICYSLLMRPLCTSTCSIIGSLGKLSFINEMKSGSNAWLKKLGLSEFSKCLMVTKGQ